MLDGHILDRDTFNLGELIQYFVWGHLFRMLDGHIPDRDTFYLGELTVGEH